MEYHVEHEIHLTREREYSTLYEWCLQERSSDGKYIGDKLIRWVWTLYFTATELTYFFSVEKDRRPFFGGDAPRSVVASERINGKLRSSERRFGSIGERQVRFSMFGTDRQIKSIHLSVCPLAAEEDEEKCYINGIVSFTDEVDFADETSDDQLLVDFSLKRSTFNRLKEMVCRERIDEAIVRVGEVSGFYSEWSPSISTRSVKVLTHGDHQKVIVNEDVTVEPPRLGEAGSFALIIKERVVPPASTPPYSDDEEALDEAAEKQSPVIDEQARNLRATEGLGQQVAQLQAGVQSLRTPLWLAVLLLLLLVFVS